jgi:predicted type IV restriction endonuclease
MCFMPANPKPSLDHFTNVVREIEANLSGSWRRSKLNEAAVRQVIVLRLLSAAGFDIWNPDEVAPEVFNPGKGWADFEVRINRKTCFLLKVKRLDSSLTDDDVVRAISYAYNKTVRWVIGTNGRTWLVYDTYLYNREASQRLVLRLDFPRKSDIEDFSRKLYGILQFHRLGKNQILR